MNAGNEWSPEDAAELYRVDSWSDGFFVVNDKGRVAVKPFDNDELTIDIMDVVADARERDLVPLGADLSQEFFDFVEPVHR
jgi:arginine decarboxylase-like protein